MTRHAFFLLVLRTTVLPAAASGGLIGCGARLPGYYDDVPLATPAAIDVPAGGATTTAFYATNRQPTGSNAAEAYTSRRADALQWGACDVRVPRVHNIGSDIVTEQLSRVLERPQPGHLRVTATTSSASADDFFAALNAAVARSAGKDVLILVHGYNNSFAGPVGRAAELAYDLGGQFVPLAYCWTSQGNAQGYTSDENDVDFAARQLAALLGQVLDRAPPGTRLHLVAHSMGSRVATLALARLKAARHPAGKLFRNLVFAAPDVDAAEFRARMVDDQLAALAERTTLYAAVYDRALQASEYVHGRTYPRAGRAGESILVMPGVDTVDVSLNDASIVGHSYYGDNRAVVNDLHMLLVLDAPPAKRNLYRATKDDQPYWLIRP